MRSRWNALEAAKAKTDLELRVYSSRLIGADPELVLHGGGNTSVKGSVVDRFGEEVDVIWLKASGFDLSTMGAEGYTALEMSKVLRLAELDELSDPDMVRDLKVARLDPEAAAASIEAIVHALIPYKYVDHSHANAVLTISNTPNGLSILKEIYGDRVLFLPYVKPGFDLALQFRNIIRRDGLEGWDAVILEHHGVFTFSHDAKESYDAMIACVQKAEDYLLDRFGSIEFENTESQNGLQIARYRKEASRLAGQAVVSLRGPSIPADKVDRIGALLRNGTLTPEHVVHNKPFPMAPVGEDAFEDLRSFKAEYKAYFERANDPSLEMLKPYPHWAIFPSGRSRSFGVNLKRAKISADVAEATLKSLLHADGIGGWQGLSETDLRGIEYWEMEQAKLKRQKPGPELTGKVAIVSGAAAGIGFACSEALRAKGAIVVGLDINAEVSDRMDTSGFEGRILDLTDEVAVASAIGDTVDRFGGLDILVSNAGIFRAGANIEDLEDEDWSRTLEVNLNSHRILLKQSIPFLKEGVDPSVVFIGSRNFAAPGAGAAAYSVSKAGLTQLMRVAALELANAGVRVNAVHPDAVFDTKLWTPKALEASAKRYGMTVDEYKMRNLLKTEIYASDVANAVVAFAGSALTKTTGAQLPVDGGNDRVI